MEKTGDICHNTTLIRMCGITQIFDFQKLLDHGIRGVSVCYRYTYGYIEMFSSDLESKSGIAMSISL